MLGILSLTRQSLLASLPTNCAPALKICPIALPPVGKFALRNADTNAAGFDKLFNAPATLLTVPATDPNAPIAETALDPKDEAACPIVRIPAPGSKFGIIGLLCQCI